MPSPGLIFVALLLLTLIHETCSAKDKRHCPPSSCGNNLNISYPFRLNRDPPHCGEIADPAYSLSCEKTLTVFPSKSGKFYVKAISYDNQTIRVADASFEEGSCFIPQYSSDATNFSTFSHYYYDHHYHYYYYYFYTDLSFWEDVLFISCGNLVSDPLYVEAPACINDSSFSTPYRPKSEGKRYYYVKIGRTTPLELKPSCRIELMALTPFIREKNYENLSYLDIHHWLAYGIQLSWQYASCGKTGFQINEENQCVRTNHDNRVYDYFISTVGSVLGKYP